MATALSELVQFFTSPEQKALLALWANEDDRTVSYVLRKLVEAEANRREEAQTKTQNREPIAA